MFDPKALFEKMQYEEAISAVNAIATPNSVERTIRAESNYALKRWQESLKDFQILLSKERKEIDFGVFEKARAAVGYLGLSEKAEEDFWRSCSDAPSFAVETIMDALINNSDMDIEAAFRPILSDLFDDTILEHLWGSALSILAAGCRGRKFKHGNTRKPRRKVVVSGMGWSGGGAVYDYLTEFEEIFPIFGEVEIIEGEGGFKKLIEAITEKQTGIRAAVEFFFRDILGYAPMKSASCFVENWSARRNAHHEAWSHAYARSVFDVVVAIALFVEVAGDQRAEVRNEGLRVLCNAIVDGLVVYMVPEDRIPLIDNALHVQNIDLARYMENIYFVCCMRDPRSNYVALKREFVGFAQNVDQYIAHHREWRSVSLQRYQFVQSDKFRSETCSVRMIHFEDFVLSQELRNEIARDMNLDLSRQKQFTGFRPWESFKNTIIHLEYENQAEIKKIEQGLSEWCVEAQVVPREEYKVLPFLSDTGLVAGLPDPAHLITAPTRFGEFVYLAGDTVIGRSLRKYGEWAAHEIDVLHRLPPPGSTILDIGANIGTHAVAFTQLRPDCVVVAFEAQPVVFAALVVNSMRLSPGRIFPRNLVVGTQERVTRFAVDYDRPSNIGAFSLLGIVDNDAAATPQSWLVPAAPLDSLSFPSRVGLIKADLEGMELSALQGAVGLLQRDHPYLFLEQNDVAQLRPILALLGSIGYRCFWLETHAFNSNNFRHNPENLWHQTEMALLAVPPGHDAPDLPPVTGDETALPRRLDPRRGIAVTLTMDGIPSIAANSVRAMAAAGVTPALLSNSDAGSPAVAAQSITHGPSPMPADYNVPVVTSAGSEFTEPISEGAPPSPGTLPEAGSLTETANDRVIPADTDAAPARAADTQQAPSSADKDDKPGIEAEAEQVPPAPDSDRATDSREQGAADSSLSAPDAKVTQPSESRHETDNQRTAEHEVLPAAVPNGFKPLRARARTWQGDVDGGQPQATANPVATSTAGPTASASAPDRMDEKPDTPPDNVPAPTLPAGFKPLRPRVQQATSNEVTLPPEQDTQLAQAVQSPERAETTGDENLGDQEQALLDIVLEATPDAIASCEGDG